MRAFFDTSALVTAIVDQVPNHAAALACYRRLTQPRRGVPKAVCSTHALAECYATLTALPLPRRIQPAEAARLIEKKFLGHLDAMPLSAADYKAALARVTTLGMRAERSTTPCMYAVQSGPAAIASSRTMCPTSNSWRRPASR